MAQALRTSVAGRILGLMVLAVALGHVEACVVAYLRQAAAPVRELHFPEAVREPLPLLSRAQLAQAGREVESLLGFEVAREVTVLLVLFAAAYGFRRRPGELAGFFLLGFAVWDIFYYVFLKLMLNWPASLGTWDILYLIPVPWLAPVWAPLLVSGTLLVASLFMLTRRPSAAAARGGLAPGVVIFVGVGGILSSFLLRWPEAMEAVPARFDWPLFLAGWLVGVAGLVWWFAQPSAARR